MAKIHRYKRPVAVVTAEVTDYDGFLDSAPLQMRDAVRHCTGRFENHKVGAILSVVVSPSNRNNGIATALVEAAVDWLRAHGATCVITVGWTDQSGCHIAGVASAMGFREVGKISQYWEEDSLTNDYECPTCGRPCHCDATLFVNSSMQRVKP